MSSITASVNPEVLRWARQRSGLGIVGLAQFLKLKDVGEVKDWEKTGNIKLTLLEKIARKAYIPVGYLFLETPPSDSLPIPDFRTTSAAQDGQKISPELLDTIRYCQFRQDWFEKKLIESDSAKLNFVNSASVDVSSGVIAESIRRELGINDSAFRKCSNWEDALRVFVGLIEKVGILVMRSGIAGSNTRRKLMVSEFRGFTLNNDYCPLIFINSNDSKSAQMFTLAHELTHIWLGQSGVSNITFKKTSEVEKLCNKVASDVLVPNAEFIREWNTNEDPIYEARRIARIHKVSSLVILIKALQHNYLGYDTFRVYYRQEVAEYKPARTKSNGGDFYLTQNVRLSKTFISSVIADTHEGNTTFIEAFQLLGIKSSTTFNRMSDIVFNA